ncbi:transposase [Bosea sp. NBC_00550]|uniref:transposase n=1 Tax=Bosea sp. NBC_00550 TaxID=2969621 RepID=UPI003FA4723A
MPNAVRMHDEQAAFLSLETLVWRDGPVCPHCRVVSIGNRNTLLFLWRWSVGDDAAAADLLFGGPAG